MNVFVTGASGWIGSAVIPQLLAAGHHVVGLARSDDAAAAVAALGAEVRRGDLDDLDGLRAGAEESDGVIHLGFKHDATDFADAGRTERAAVETLCKALEGSDRPFLSPPASRCSRRAGCSPSGTRPRWSARRRRAVAPRSSPSPTPSAACGR